MAECVKCGSFTKYNGGLCRKCYKKEGNNPYGIIQSKTFGAPTVSGNISNPLLKEIVNYPLINIYPQNMTA